jgi:hypothetical protein
MIGSQWKKKSYRNIKVLTMIEDRSQKAINGQQKIVTVSSDIIHINVIEEGGERSKKSTTQLVLICSYRISFFPSINMYVDLYSYLYLVGKNVIM